MPEPSPLDAQLDALRVALTALYGARPMESVSVKFYGVGEPVVIPLPAPAAALSAAAKADPGATLTDWQEAILGVIDRLPVGATTTNEAIVREAGFLGPNGPNSDMREFIRTVGPDNGLRRAQYGWRKT